MVLLKNITIISSSFASSLLLGHFLAERKTYYLWLSFIWLGIVVQILNYFPFNNNVLGSFNMDQYFSEFYFLYDCISFSLIIIFLNLFIITGMNKPEGKPGRVMRLFIFTSTLLSLPAGFILSWRHVPFFVFFYEGSIMLQISYCFLRMKLISDKTIASYIKFIILPLVSFIMFLSVSFYFLVGQENIFYAAGVSHFVILSSIFFFSLISIIFFILFYPATLKDGRKTNHNHQLDHMITPLSRREEEVLPLILADETNEQIADKLSIALTTVKSHVKSILKKYGVATKREFLKKFRDNI